MAEYIFTKLTEALFSVWRDRDAIMAGDAWEPLMMQAVDDCQALVLILSPEALASHYVHMEYTRALEKHKLVLPLLYRAGGTLPEQLQGLQIIDFQHRSRYERAMLELVQPLMPLLRPESYVPPTTGPISRPLHRKAVLEPTNMPRPITFVGRDQEVEQIMTALRGGNVVGVCALQGMGGIGKSALAAIVVDRLRTERDAFPGGAAWISAEGLSGAEGLDELINKIAFMLDFDDVALMPTPAARQALLVRHLAVRPRMLLAIDNLEPGFPAAALVLALIIPQHIALLLTARQQIKADMPTQITLEPLPEVDAETLLQRRLHQADETRPSSDDTTLLPAVAAALGGLPLALELTAAYAGQQQRSMQWLLNDVQAHGLSASPLADPQRGLRYSFQRSWQVLTPAQQQLFARISVIEGATFLRAAAEVLADEASPSPTAQVDALVSLALVEALPRERLRLHPFLREYAQEHLDEPTGNLARRALATFYATYVVTTDDHDLVADEASINAAIEWAHAQQENLLVADMCDGMREFWRDRSRTAASRRYLPWGITAAEHIAQESNNREDKLRIARLSLAYATVLLTIGDKANAQHLIEANISQRQELGDQRGEGVALSLLGDILMQRGDLTGAEGNYQQVRQIMHEVGDQRGEGVALGNLGNILMQRGDLTGAEGLYTQYRQIMHEVGDQQQEGVALYKMARIAEQRHDYDQAEDWHRQSLAIGEAMANAQDIADSLLALGQFLIERRANATEGCPMLTRTIQIYEALEMPDVEYARQVAEQCGC